MISDILFEWKMKSESLACKLSPNTTIVAAKHFLNSVVKLIKHDFLISRLKFL